MYCETKKKYVHIAFLILVIKITTLDFLILHYTHFKESNQPGVDVISFFLPFSSNQVDNYK